MLFFQLVWQFVTWCHTRTCSWCIILAHGTNKWCPTASTLCPSVDATKNSDKSQLRSKQTQMDHPQRMSWLLVAISNVGKCVDKKSPRVTMHASFLTPMTTVSVCIGISHALPYSTVCTLPLLLSVLFVQAVATLLFYVQQCMAMAVYKTAESVYTTCIHVWLYVNR